MANSWTSRETRRLVGGENLLLRTYLLERTTGFEPATPTLAKKRCQRVAGRKADTPPEQAFCVSEVSVIDPYCPQRWGPNGDQGDYGAGLRAPKVSPLISRRPLLTNANTWIQNDRTAMEMMDGFGEEQTSQEGGRRGSPGFEGRRMGGSACFGTPLGICEVPPRLLPRMDSLNAPDSRGSRSLSPASHQSLPRGTGI